LLDEHLGLDLIFFSFICVKFLMIIIVIRSI